MSNHFTIAQNGESNNRTSENSLPLFNYFASNDRFFRTQDDGAYCQSNDNQIVPDHALSCSAISFNEQSNERTTNGSISMIDRKESYKSQACENTITHKEALIDTCKKDSAICDQVISLSNVNVREESSQSQEKEQISVHDYSVNITDDGNIPIPKSILNDNKRITSINEIKTENLNPNEEVDPLNINKKDSSPTLSYRDFSTTDIYQVSIITGYKKCKKNITTFPFKLHQILERSDIDGYSSIISWAKHGRSFKIHNRPLFMKRVLSIYFYTSDFSSFSRNLGSYGFHKITASDNQDRYSYYNELFLRGRSELCSLIIRKTARSLIIDEKHQPDLYEFEPLPKSDELPYEKTTGIKPIVYETQSQTKSSEHQ